MQFLYIVLNRFQWNQTDRYCCSNIAYASGVFVYLFYLAGRKKCENLKLWIWSFLLSPCYTTNQGSNTPYIVLTYDLEVLLRYFTFSFSDKKPKTRIDSLGDQQKA